jgi:TAG lipase/lysophosphatidylethanolamine acyltransferase
MIGNFNGFAFFTLCRNSGLLRWRKKPRSVMYDYELILVRTQRIRQCIEKKDISSLVFILSSGFVRNLGGICNAQLFRKARSGTKLAIEEYLEVVKEALDLIDQCTDLDSSVKYTFFCDSLKTFGQTALILFGGANFGHFHIGVVKELNLHGLLPRVFCGLSVGAIIAAFVCTRKDVETLYSYDEFNFSAFQLKGQKDSIKRKIVRFLKHGVLMDIHVLEQFVRDNLGNMTFQEAFRLTGRVLNILVYSNTKNERPFIMNYLTTPNVVIWSAACASCSIPGLYDNVKILSKGEDEIVVPWIPAFEFEGKWREFPFSTSEDLNLSRLVELFGVNNFIVSHVNSYIVLNPFFYLLSYTPSMLFSISNFIADEIRHYLLQLSSIGLFPKWISKLQRYFASLEGDVNIYPSMAWKDITLILSNPNASSIQYFVRKGQQATWRVLEEIKIRCAIERSIDRGISLQYPASTLGASASFIADEF